MYFIKRYGNLSTLGLVTGIFGTIGLQINHTKIKQMYEEPLVDEAMYHIRNSKQIQSLLNDDIIINNGIIEDLKTKINREDKYIEYEFKILSQRKTCKIFLGASAKTLK